MNENNDKKMAIAFISSFVLLIVAFFIMPKVLKQNQPVATAPTLANTLATALPTTNLNATAASNVTATPAATATSIRFTQNTAATNVIVGYPESLSLIVDSDGAVIREAMITGPWNRLGETVNIFSPTNSVPMSDFYFGSLASLRLVTERPVYRIDSLTSNSVRLVADVNFNGSALRLTRTFEVSSNYVYNETLNIENRTRVPVQVQDSGKAFTFASTFQFSSRDRVNSQNVAMFRYYDGNKLHTLLKSGFLKSLTGNRPTEEIAPLPVWLAHSDNYFVSVMKPMTAGLNGRITITTQEKNYQEAVMALEVDPFILNAGETKTFTVSYYLGPKKEDLMKVIDPTYKKIFAWSPLFNWLMKPIEWLISKGMFLISKVINNWGIIIMLLALVIKLLLSPLSIKAAISMKRTQLMQPKLKNLQEKYKDDQQTLQQKTVELYKKEGVNPLGGCWPMLVQIPVFFALFRVLSTSIELRGAKFLWIKDLTQPDTLFMMNIPLLPHQFNLLPIVMTIISLVQTYLQQGKNQVSMSGQKQSMLQVYMMPVLFLFLFWNMPAGLVLYWTIQNIYSIVEQQIINLDKKIILK